MIEYHRMFYKLILSAICCAAPLPLMANCAANCTIRVGSYGGKTVNTSDPDDREIGIYMQVGRKNITVDLNYPNGRGVHLDASRLKCTKKGLKFQFADDGWGRSGSGIISAHGSQVELEFDRVDTVYNFPAGLPSEIISIYSGDVMRLHKVPKQRLSN